MKIDMIKVSVREIVEGYSEDDSTSRVVAWGGKLDVRPQYQREYVYDETKRDAVINTVLKKFPLNIMYFVKRPDSTYEVLDGQQRIISICRYKTNQFSVKVPAASGGFNNVNFPNLFNSQSEDFLDYQLQVYVCEGTDQEKLEWFEIINIAGETLERQEILNALYHSVWLTDAKSLFSRRNCIANKNYGKYMNGEYIRQKYLETAITWAADADGITGKNAVATYMQNHRNNADADALWKYFEDVFTWVQNNFGKYDKTMKGVKWGLLFNAHKDDNLDVNVIKAQISDLMGDKEVQKKSGIYEYILTGEEKVLQLRVFENDEKITIYNQQGGKCKICGQPFDISEMHGDHITPWSKGGKTTIDNLQMLCVTCNLKKGVH